MAIYREKDTVWARMDDPQAYFCQLVITLHNDVIIIPTRMDSLHAFLSCCHAVYIHFARVRFIPIGQIGDF